MPRGENPNSKKNLKNRFNADTAQKANKKSQQAKREYKTFQECFKDSITSEQREELFNVMYRKAKAGNIKAFEVLRDTLGEKPVEKVQVAEIDQETIDEVARLFNEE